MYSEIKGQAIKKINMDLQIKEDGIDAKKPDLDFYQKSKKEYLKASKPFIYPFQIQLKSTKIKKFSIVVGKFIEIFKSGIKLKYLDEDELQQNYWNMLENYFTDDIQMMYVSSIHEKKSIKLRIFFVLSLHAKTLFRKIRQIPKNIQQLYENPKQKIEKINKDLEILDFLEDGQYNIEFSLIEDYNKFREEYLERQILRKKQKQQQERILREEQERKKQQQLQQQQRQRKRRQLTKQIQANNNPNTAAYTGNNQRQKDLEILYAENQSKGNLASAQNERKKRQLKISVPESENKGKISSRPLKVNEFVNNITSKQQTTYQPQEYNEAVKPKGVKNSQFYLKAIEEQSNIFSFRMVDKPSENNKECYQCKKPLSEGFFIFGGNINYCHYTGQWYCNDCMSEQRVPIPQKAKQQFDLKGYSVCNRALREIKSLFEKAIIEIDIFNHEDNRVIKQHRKLYDFLILKRQIHLMYDSICNPVLMERLFDKKNNYFLKRNLLSLKNLKDIYNGYEGPTMEKEFNFLVKHFYKCDTCQSRKGHICAFCQHPPKIFSFELKETYSCKNCSKIYHRRCMKNGKCPCDY